MSVEMIKQIECFASEHLKLYAYGAGYYGKIFVNLANLLGIKINGFLVTNKERNMDNYCDYPVYDILDISLENSGIVLTVSEDKHKEIIDFLQRHGNKSDILYFTDNSIQKCISKLWNQNYIDRILNNSTKYDKNNPIRIAIFTHCTGMMGASRSLMENIMFWSMRQDTSLLVITHEYGELNDNLEKMGIVNLIYNFHWWANKPDEIKNNEKKIICDIAWLLLKLNINVCYSNGSVIDIGARVAEKIKTPHIWHIREFAISHYGFEFIGGNISALKYIQSSSCKVLFTSKALKNGYEEIIGKHDNFLVIYDGVSSKGIKMHNEKYKVGDKLKIVMIGCVDEGKNQLDVIKALNILARKGIYAFEVHFYGPEDEQYKIKLKKLIKKYNLYNNVFFHGYVDDVRSRMSKYSIGIMSSKKEAFGRATVEYLMAGLITIATNTGANVEILKNGKYGMLYSYGHPEELASCLYNILSNCDELVRNSVSIRKETIERFLPENTANQIIEVFRQSIKD